MIARQEEVAGADVWARLAANVPVDIIQWRQQGRGKAREGKFFAPFVAYIDAQFVRERLDTVVPGEWDLTLELLPSLLADAQGEAMDEPISFKARLQILGVIREDVGCGKDYKTASTDAFKRAAVRFGIGHELYTDYEICWVQVDGDGKYAKAMEDPAEVYARKCGAKGSNGTGNRTVAVRADGGEARPSSTRNASPPAPTPSAPSGHPGDAKSCPKCGGAMFDNRLTKRNPRAPDFKCKTRTCDGVIWPSRSEPEPGEINTGTAVYNDDAPPHDDRDLPF